MNNNNVSPEKKSSILKSLAVLGLISIIAIIAWLSIQFVTVLPGAFSSLASLAEGLNQSAGSETSMELTQLTVTSDSKLVNVGEPITISWDTAEAAGSYTFRYECNEGVAVDLINIDGLQSIACNTNYNIGNIDTLSIAADSEKERFAELQYSIAFLKTNDQEPRAAGSASLTLINNEIADMSTSTDTDDVAVDTATSTPETPAPVAEVEVETPTTPTYQQEYTYTIPVSNPNGRTDLATKFLSVGRIIGNTFFTGEIKQDEQGAVQFEVKNYGTKTSGNWTFSVTLPNGDVYNSATQLPLKPNERAVLTIGFTSDDSATHTFVVQAKESSDTTILNNSFSQTVRFIE